MVLEKDILPFSEWLLFGPQGFGAFFVFLFLVAVASLLAITFCYVITAVRQGPVEAFYVVAQVIANAIPDFLKTTPRRVLAMAHLAVKESVRRKVLVGFVIFAIVLLYAGWFLDVRTDHPARLYLSFAMTATNYLVLVLALFLSTFSLPNDIKNRTIYTVVTKPVRAFEIVLGRVLGFGFVGTVLLALMGIVSYGFVVRNLSHRHQLEATPDEIAAALEKDGKWEGETTQDRLHRHRVRIDRDAWESGQPVLTETEQEHWHVVARTGEGPKARVTLGPPEGQLVARVPVYGQLRFLSRSGGPGKGVNVGNEWNYRSYIEGGTLAAAIWTFEGVTPERFPDGLPLELNIRIFRTHKGDQSRGVMGTILLKNPNQSAKINSSTPRNFFGKEFVIDRQLIPRKLTAMDPETSTIKEIDLFDLVQDGKVEVWLSCAERGQYFGMAKPDMYLRATNRPFWWNFIKGYVGTWLQMLLVVSFGVMFSTFLNGPISMLTTMGALILGLAAPFIGQVLGGAIQGTQLLNGLFGAYFGNEDVALGGGPIESLIRLLTQSNVMVELDMHWLPEMIIKYTDVLLMSVMRGVTVMLPDFSYFNTADYLAYGFNIDGQLVAQQATVTLAYMFVLTVTGYFFLKTREIAA